MWAYNNVIWEKYSFQLLPLFRVFCFRSLGTYNEGFEFHSLFWVFCFRSLGIYNKGLICLYTCKNAFWVKCQQPKPPRPSGTPPKLGGVNLRLILVGGDNNCCLFLKFPSWFRRGDERSEVGVVALPEGQRLFGRLSLQNAVFVVTARHGIFYPNRNCGILFE